MGEPEEERGGALLSRILRAGVVGLSLYYLLLFVYLAFRRMGYPFELEWMEGGMLAEVRRILAGGRLYVGPGIDFVPFMYPPLYFYVSAAAARLLGAGFVPLRAVSFASTLVSCALIALIVRREARSVLGALAAGCLFAATYGLTTGWFDVARVDSLFVCLLLAGLYLIRFHESIGADIASAVLLTLAFLTKQTGLLISIPVALYVLWSRRRRSVWFMGAWIVTLAGSTILLDRIHQGWFAYYIFKLPRGHHAGIARLAAFWIRDIIQPLSICSLFALAWLLVVGPARAERKPFLFHLLAAAGMVGGAWISKAPEGGWANLMMPAYASLAVFFGLVIGRSESGLRSRGAAPAATKVVLTAAIVQFLALAYLPSPLLPTASDRAAGEELVRRIAELPGDVLIPRHGYLAVMAGKPGFAHELAVTDLIMGDSGPARVALVAQIRKAISDRRFGAIVLDGPWFEKEVEASYPRREPALADEGAMWPVSGGRTRPAWICLPDSGRAAQP